MDRCSTPFGLSIRFELKVSGQIVGDLGSVATCSMLSGR